MNSRNLINLAFDHVDRDYMKFHLDKFHPNYSENQFGYTAAGFANKTSVSEDMLNLFKDVNV